MEQKKRQQLLLIILIAFVLVGGFYLWLEQGQQLPLASTASVPAINTGVSSTTPEVVVYISGYVVRPGVYKLSAESRAIDFVNAAGGFAAGANASGINLAQKLKDGMQVNVPGNLSPNVSNVAAQVSGKISLNTADKKQLEALPGVGPALAGRILEYRTTHGGFKTVEELKKVSGIGDAKYNALKDKITL